MKKFLWISNNIYLILIPYSDNLKQNSILYIVKFLEITLRNYLK